ncbi:MAG: MmgE/PrpD family protein [Planctomycetes bacterium]|nr:MmgE/PrpD family protein [Planctomycetota bacterium]
MKAFPTEALTHSPITATLHLIKEHGLKAEDVKEVYIESIARAADILSDPSKYDPQSKETADHSLPWCIAAALADGMVTPQQFKEERLHDQRIRSQLNKVKVVANEDFEKAFPEKQCTNVTITTTAGKKHSHRIDVPKGDPRDPMTEDEIAVKFNALGKGVVGEEKCNELRVLIMSMEEEESLGRLFALMTT